MENLQRQRERREKEGARERAAHARARLKGQGAESATEYGRRLFAEYGEAVQLGLDAALTTFLFRPGAAGPHYAALPVLLHFSSRGPSQVAAVGLRVVLDKLSRRQPLRTLQVAVGRAIENEVKALALHPDVLRLVKRRSGVRAATSKGTLRQLRVEHDRWPADCCAEVGGLLIDVIAAETPLLKMTGNPRPGALRARMFVEPTETALEIIQANPPRPLGVRRLPMLVPPRPWEGLTGGGHITDNTSRLVNSRQPRSFEYLERADLTPALEVVNRLQQQQMRIDPWMVEQQRIAWDANIRGLFPVLRDPITAPPRPQERVGPEAYREWQQQVLASRQDQRDGATSRARIETAIRQCEEVAGRPLWFAYDLDFRGRVYTSNRYATHQGPDWEKGAIEFGRGEPCGQDGVEWLLMAAAGHWGLNRKTWAERLAWGQENAGRLVAAAEEPLDRLEAWRDAKDPWQFLQAARAFKQWRDDPSAAIRCPVRLDQTTSGLGILAALTRDRVIAESCNLIGAEPNDLYARVAEQVLEVVRADLETGSTQEQRNAAVWLEVGIDRKLMKGPVMTTTYGAMYLGLLDGLTDQLQERLGVVRTTDYESKLLRPARYLTTRVTTVLRREVATCLAVQKWLRAMGLKVVSQQQRLRWTTPMGFPIDLGVEAEATSKVTTLVNGTPRWKTPRDRPIKGELGARATCRSITANLVHTFDAAFCWAIVYRAGLQGAEVLPNHDCFAMLPSRAGWLHKTLHDELRELYKTDWLTRVRDEISCNAGIKGLPAPPLVGSLEPGEIGHNPYAFS